MTRLNLTQRVATCLLFVVVVVLVAVVIVIVAVWGVQTDALIVCHLFSPAQAAVAVAAFIIVAFSFVYFLFFCNSFILYCLIRS